MRPVQTSVDAFSHFRDTRVSHTLQFSPYGRYMTTATKGSTKKKTAVATPWGKAQMLERVAVQQRAGDKRFSSLVELLELDNGERLVRLAYTTDGVVRRGPVTLRERDLGRLRQALAATHALSELFSLGEGA